MDTLFAHDLDPDPPFMITICADTVTGYLLQLLRLDPMKIFFLRSLIRWNFPALDTPYLYFPHEQKILFPVFRIGGSLVNWPPGPDP
jgi:hypothetical protein